MQNLGLEILYFMGDLEASLKFRAPIFCLSETCMQPHVWWKIALFAPTFKPTTPLFQLLGQAYRALCLAVSVMSPMKTKMCITQSLRSSRSGP